MVPEQVDAENAVLGVTTIEVMRTFNVRGLELSEDEAYQLLRELSDLLD